MQIVTVSEQKDFVKYSTRIAIETLAHMLGAEYTCYELHEWKSRLITPYSDNDIIVIFEGTYMQVANMDTKELKRLFPNAKLVCLSSDAIYFVTTGEQNGCQFQDPRDVDLFLDCMTDCVDFYTRMGVNADTWMWTISILMPQLIEQNIQIKPWDEREYDFIGVYAPHTIARPGSYRNAMVNHIETSGFKFTQGGGSGHDDSDILRLLNMYNNAKLTLGTTSHDNPRFHGMKGFRDWIGPFLGAPLIYDNYKDVVEMFCGYTNVPIYEYGRFEEIIQIYNDLEKHPLLIKELARTQSVWAQNNAIEAQLLRRMVKHGILTHPCLKSLY